LRREPASTCNCRLAHLLLQCCAARFALSALRNGVVPILLLILQIALLIPPTSHAENSRTLQESPNPVKERSSNKAQPGFYLEIKRSYVRAYAGWQKRAIGLLRAKSFQAFNGDPQYRITESNLVTIEFLKKTSKPTQIISPVFIGPYPSGEVAEKKIPELLSALKPLIDDEKKNDELHNRHLFLVGVVRVKS